MLRFYTALAGGGSSAAPMEAGAEAKATTDLAASCEARFTAAMNDDFNTPIAVAVLFELASELNRTRSSLIEQTLKRLAGLLGLLQRDAAQVVRSGLNLDSSNTGGLTDAAIDELIAQRAAAKKIRNFSAADSIRQQLTDAGIVLEDSAAGTRWRRG